MPFLTYVRELWRRRQVDAEIDDELAFHVEQDVQANIARGLSPGEARRAALRDLGGMAQTREATRGIRMTWLDDIARDVAQAARGFFGRPTFAAVTVLTLTLGIGGATTIFSLLDAVVLKPLSVPNASDLVALHEIGPEGAADAVGGTGRYLRFSYPRFERLAAALGDRGQLAAVTRSYRMLARLPGESTARSMQGQLVSQNFFTVLGMSAARGRVFTADDVRQAPTRPSAVISDSFWRAVLLNDAAVLGSTITVNGIDAMIIGVMPAGFGGIWTDAEAQVWLPITMQQPLHYRSNSSTYGPIDETQSWLLQDAVSWVNLIAAIPPGNRAAAAAALNAANAGGLADLAATFRTESTREAMLAHVLLLQPVRSGFSGLRTRFSDALLILFGLVALVLLITCANICNLMLARATARQRELGIRRSLGASTSRLIRRDVTESLMLTIAGGAGGLLFSIAASRWMATQVLTTATLPVVFAPDGRLLAFCAALTLLTALIVGIVPAWLAARSTPQRLLGSAQRTTASARTLLGMRSIVVAQLALSVPVIVASILLGRAFGELATTDPGFSTDSVVSVSMDPATAGFRSDQVSALTDRLLRAVSVVPGVASAAVSRCGLIAGCASSSNVYADGRPEGLMTYQNWVTPLYFSTVGIDLLVGRAFTDLDVERSEPVAIVSESVAKRLFGDAATALGRSIGLSRPTARVVGIVRDVRSASLHDEPTSMVYFPITQRAANAPMVTNVDIRVVDERGLSAESLRATLRQTEPTMLFDSASTVAARLRRDLGRERLAAYVTRAFAALTLLLTGLGLFGVLSYTVGCQTTEIGVRMAMGATSRQIYALVMRQGSLVTLIGLIAGAASAAATVRYLGAFVWSAVPSLEALLLAAGSLAIVAFWSCYLPARRATRINPLGALRAE